MMAAPDTLTAPTATFAASRVLPSWERVVGLLIIAVVPALFWMGVLGGTASAFGVKIGLAALAVVGIAIGGFLVVVCSVLSARRA